MLRTRSGRHTPSDQFSALRIRRHCLPSSLQFRTCKARRAVRTSEGRLVRRSSSPSAIRKKLDTTRRHSIRCTPFALAQVALDTAPCPPDSHAVLTRRRARRLQTTSPSYRKSDFSVLRRYSHFVWLYEALTQNNPGVIVPGMPEKHAIGTLPAQASDPRSSSHASFWPLPQVASVPILSKTDVLACRRR